MTDRPTNGTDGRLDDKGGMTGVVVVMGGGGVRGQVSVPEGHMPVERLFVSQMVIRATQPGLGGSPIEELKRRGSMG